MRWILLFICIIGSNSETFAADPPVNRQQELQTIDQKIFELREAQERARSLAERKANNAIRWQFQNENYMDARRAWDEVAALKTQIQEMQVEVDKLEARKQEILREHAG